MTTTLQSYIAGRWVGREAAQELRSAINGQVVARTHAEALDFGAAAADQFTTVLPVGTRADVERVLRLLLPHLPEQEWPFVFEHGILGPHAGNDPYTNTPRRARLLRPLSWRRNGFLLVPDALLLRRGFIWRTLALLPLARLQSLGIDQGPLDRRLSVANLRAHTIAGRVSGSLGIIDRDAALGVFDDAEAAAINAAVGDRSHRWAEPPATVLGPTAAVPGPTATVPGPVEGPHPEARP